MRRCTGLQCMKTFSLVKTLKTRSVSPDVNLKKRNDVSIGCLSKRYLGLSPNTQLVLIYMLLCFFFKQYRQSRASRLNIFGQGSFFFLLCPL